MTQILTDALRAAPGAAAGIALLLGLLMIAVLMLVTAAATIAVRSLRWPAAERRDALRMVEALGAILVALIRGRPPDGG